MATILPGFAPRQFLLCDGLNLPGTFRHVHLRDPGRRRPGYTVCE